MKNLLFTIFALLLFTKISTAQTNSNPVVTITAPTRTVVVYSNQTYTVTANATDADGIAKVEFYAGTQLIGTDTEAPYSAILSTTNFPQPTWGWNDWSITVKAYDRTGATTSVSTNSTTWLSMRTYFDAGIKSAGVNGTEGRALTCWFTLNKNGATNITSARIGYQLDNQPERFLDWTGNIIDASFSQTINLPTLTNTNGLHTIKYRIVSRNGQASDEVAANDVMSYTFLSNIINKLPTVALVAPVANIYVPTTILSNQTFTFKATAKDPDGTIKKVDFYFDNTLIASDDTEPYEFTKSSFVVGTYIVVAKATDDSDGVTTSTAAKLIVKPNLDVALSDIKQPYLSMTTPTITPMVTLKNTGSDIITSAAIAYSVDGSNPILFNWTGSLAANVTVNVSLPVFRNENGAHTFVATVSNPNGSIDGDNSNNMMTRSYTSAVVNSLPTVKMLTPSYLSTIYSGTEFTFSASATDRDGWITKVEFYLGGTLLGTDTEAPYELKRSDIAVGTYAITAKAYDDREGGVSVSAATTLKVIPALNIAISSILQPVAAPTTPVIAPIVGLKNLGNIVITSAKITYAVDGGEVKSLDWTGSLAANATVNVTLPTFRNENGTHTFATTVSNPNGGVDGNNSDNSKTLTFLSKVINTLPSVNMLIPSYRSTIKSKDAFTLSANATDRDGWVTKVEFYLGTTLVGTVTQAPYALTLREWQVGTYEVTTRAYDDRNGIKISNITTLIVTQAVANSIIKNVENNQEQIEKTTLNTENNSQVIVETNFKANYRIKEDNNLLLAPNPASNYTNMSINLSKEGEYKLMITNMSGKTVQSNTVQFNKGDNRLELDVTTLPAGLYFVSLNNNESSMTKKLIVTK